ncbi:vWA domain-containing protein [Neobacillus dielmonensis]|uniref:vWA domain-containing protein n=1 Tax=Neobacillus dielmonensis TaxID=1347369 RepID=UPI000B259E3D|nr:VWA domain-containing protein [Neobacillus dielmonensis]
MAFSQEEFMLSKIELEENPSPRVPICLVLDTSYSMYGEPIKELNNGVKLFMDSIRRDDIASASAEISMVTFGGTVKQVFDFGSIHRQTIPHLGVEGVTPMGEAVNLALDLLERRKMMYSQSGVDYYQPWIVIMTDGAPTDDIARAASRTSDLVNKKKLTIFPIGIGPSADMNTLKQFSPKRQPLRLKGLKFVEFFEWLSKSISMVSKSTPGEEVKLDVASIPDWGSL